MTYQVLVCEVRNVGRFDVQVFESLGILVDELVKELSLNLVFAANRPP
jgi:hypothetical protein